MDQTPSGQSWHGEKKRGPCDEGPRGTLQSGNGSPPAAVAGGAGSAAAGTAFAPAAVPKDLYGGQDDGPGDEENEKDIEPHTTLPPTASPRGAGGRP